ncbi:tetratricopeptide repeat protein [Mucilaginibacter sp. HMF5004]|uniref:tetratricopeptide repeat protein n=1 Tax=Mucilaginibacter rivuli TaxID=2857527 RepID=UPI001C5E634C|nr:tetratricopeptide repeat protein [Mucilaginibacter rivuli]MBW4891910.1 tetratricopeptide repeat protein [Mucilaginibacter rivuli]
MKDVANNLALYNKSNDYKYLTEAKKAIDGSFKTHADSLNLEKNTFKAVVYSTILYRDSLNTLKLPDTLLRQTTRLVNMLSVNRKIYRYATELNYVKGCIANVYLRKAFDFYDKNNFRQAIVNFDIAKGYVPDKQIDTYLANIYYKLGNYKTAVIYYDQLLAEPKPKIEYIQTATTLYNTLGDTTKALQAIQKGLSIYGHDKYLLFEEANIYNNKKDYAVLNTLLEELLYLAPNDLNVLFMAANCYDHLNRFQDAERTYKKLIDINNADYNPTFNLGLLYLKRCFTAKKHDDVYWAGISKSRDMLEKASEMNPNNEECLKALQMLYLQTGNQNQLKKVESKLRQLTN